MADYGHLQTEKELAELEKRIAKLYKEAADDLEKTIKEYFAKLEKRDEEMKKLVEAEEITEEHYKQWRLNQIGRGKRFEALRDKIAERYTKANETAVAYVNDTTPGIYTLNRNYAAYEIEQVSDKVDFTLWDESTVRRLAVEEPDLMPYYPKKKALKRGIDLDYGKKQITHQVTSGILLGEGIGKVANRLQENIPNMNRVSAIRTARTSVTGAQNAGRMDSYAAAEKMGIELQKEWLATLDNRTRHSHALMDGERADNDKKFPNGCMYPGDPEGPPWEVYNCRCTLIAAVKGVDTSDAKRRTKDGAVNNITYKEWEAQKEVEFAEANGEAAKDALKFFSASKKDDLRSIVKRSTIKLQNGFAAFPDGDKLNEYAKKVKPLKKYYDVAMHGTPTGVCFGSNEENMTARLLAAVIRHSEGYEGQNIRLLSCSTGRKEKDSACFAEELSNALGVVVKAPNDTLFISANGDLRVGSLGKGSFVDYKPNERRRLK